MREKQTIIVTRKGDEYLSDKHIVVMGIQCLNATHIVEYTYNQANLLLLNEDTYIPVSEIVLIKEIDNK